jgi:hypothetical protein
MKASGTYEKRVQLKWEVQMSISQVTFFINLPKTGQEKPSVGLSQKY